MPDATLDDALELVVSQFRGITDKGGQPYILHCLRVMMAVSDPLAQQVGLMHDLLEDTTITSQELRDRGFCNAVVDAVQLLTHDPSDSYTDYVLKLAPNELARQVKLADIHDNYSLCRVPYRGEHVEEDLRRMQRYVLSYQVLMHHINEADYRRRMQDCE